MRSLNFVLAFLGMVVLGSNCAQADSVTISGSSLSGLKYGANGGSAVYSPADGGLAVLSTTDSGLNGGAPIVYVTNTYFPGIGTLGSLNASYDLKSFSGPSGVLPYFLTYVYEPNSTGYIGIISMGGPTLDSSTKVHVFWDYASDPLSSNTFWDVTLGDLCNTAYGSTTFGQLAVYETGIEIGVWDNGTSIIPSAAEIRSITVTSVPVPAAGWTGLALLGGLAANKLRKRLM
jgi:hypothetical protein